MQLPFIKKKQPYSGLELKHLVNMEEGFFDNFQMYYDMYTDYLRTQQFKKIDNVVGGLIKVYNREDRILKIYEKQAGYIKDELEEKYLKASKEYVLFGTRLMYKLTTNCVKFKEDFKENRLDPKKIEKFLEGLDKELEIYQRFKDLKEKAYEALD